MVAKIKERRHNVQALGASLTKPVETSSASQDPQPDAIADSEAAERTPGDRRSAFCS